MKNFKIITLTISICFFANSYSQTWCPPGATWYYSSVGGWFDGYEKHTYSHDTVINSVNCKEITRYIEGSGIMGYQSYYSSAYYTYEQNGVVYIYNNRFGMSGFDTTNGFDTLYNISAQVGDKWRLPMVDTTCVDSSYFVEIQNMGTKVINGFNLKWWYVKVGPIQYYQDYIYTYDTIVERLGYKFQDIAGSSYAYCNNLSDEGSGGYLRCYSDSIFGYLSTGIATSCNYYYTGVIEFDKSQRNIKVFPNPANNRLIISVDITLSGKASIELFDIMGKLCCSQKLNQYVTKISITDLDAGMYMYKININNNVIKSDRLIVIH